MEDSNKDLISRRKFLKVGALATAALTIGIAPGRFAQADPAEDAPQNPNQLGFMHNQELCIGCQSCEAACKKANNWDEGVHWRRVLQVKQNYVYLSLSCNHCENPACVAVCPVKAYTKREKDGIVVHDPTRCVGCKYCLYACPYHAPQFSDAAGRVSKCHFCSARQEQGEEPACVSICPTKALTCGPLADLRKTPGGVAQLKGLPDPDLTKPSWVIIPKA